MQLSNQSYDPIDSVDLETIYQKRNDQGPVFSVYLSLHPETQNAGDLVSRFERLLNQYEQQKKLDQNPASYRQQWDTEVERVQNWLKNVRPQHARGLALVTSQPAGLWNVFLLPVPPTDRLVISDRPYLRPLEILMGEFACTLVVLVDEWTARLVKVFLGNTEEIANIQAVPVTGGGYHDGLQQHARMVAEQVETAWQNQTCAHLVIGGPDEVRGVFREVLSGPLRERISGETHLSPQSGLEEIVDQIQEIEDEQEVRLESQRVEQIIRIAGDESEKTAVLGMEQTLLAVRAKKVRLLAADEDFHLAGGECPNCGFLGEWEQGICLLCEMALKPEPDIIEAALKHVLDEGGEIDVLRSPGARRALEPHGRIGALLYDGETKPTEKVESSQETITRHGQVRTEAVHDEVVDESFPASDPPGW